MKTMFVSLLIAVDSWLFPVSAQTPNQDEQTGAIDWHDEDRYWKRFTRHHFTVDGKQCWVAVPSNPRSGNPWVWCMEFPTAFDDRTGVVPLVENGFYYAYMNVGNTFGSPAAQEHFDRFYEHMTAKGLSPRVSLIGVSRGGLYAYRFASRNPARVVCIYGDAPVCDFKSWPGGKGKGKGSSGDWQSLLKHYGFKDEAEALAYPGNPVDILAPLAAANIPLIHVVGDTDDVVPVEENTAVIEYAQALGARSLSSTSLAYYHPRP